MVYYISGFILALRRKKMDIINDNQNGRDLEKEYMRYGKYRNINNDLLEEQNKKFYKLFPPGTEKYIFLFLRATNIYILNLQQDLTQFNSNQKYKDAVFQKIFGDYDFSKIILYETSCPVPNALKNYYNFIYETNHCLKILKDFFDKHFTQNGDNIFYNNFFTIATNGVLDYDEHNIYNQFKLTDPHALANIFCLSTLVNDQFYDFLNTIMKHANKMPNFIRENFWSESKFSSLKDYISNLFNWKFFQHEKYDRCFVRYNNTLSEWNANNSTAISITTFDSNDLAQQVAEVYYQNNGAPENDYSYCINISFHTPKKAMKPNKQLIKTYLKYFTMNNPSVLDSLSLDFINSILLSHCLHKNTIVNGDYDKFDKWRTIFGFDSIASCGLIRLYPFNMQIRTDNLLNVSEEDINNTIKKHAEPNSMVRYCHRYFLLNHDAKLSNSIAKKVNFISFPYGGEFYNYEPLSNVDRLEIVKLLLVHGWHLLNNIHPQKTPKAKTSDENLIFKHLKNTDDTRIPLNVLHKIYNHFIDSKITDTELQKELVKKGFIYETKAIRAQDKTYLQKLLQDAGKHFCELEIRDTPKQKAISCKLDPEFWNEVSPERKKENEDKNAAEFNEYLKELAEKYAPFFVENTPEKPVSNDTLKGFVPLDKLKDEDLQ